MRKISFFTCVFYIFGYKFGNYAVFISTHYPENKQRCVTFMGPQNSSIPLIVKFPLGKILSLILKLTGIFPDPSTFFKKVGSFYHSLKYTLTTIRHGCCVFINISSFVLN